MQADPIPGWDRDRALTALGVTHVPFAHVDGNAQGYAQGRSVAINPLAVLPGKTLFHELAHLLLHETGEAAADCRGATRSIREVEAEAVALICCETLGLAGATYARGYIQHWSGDGKAIPEANARRIFRAAGRILSAGRVTDEQDGPSGPSLSSFILPSPELAAASWSFAIENRTE